MGKAIDSALEQDYPNLEVIVVDDASPDRTAEVVSSRVDKRLKYVRNATNIGRVANYRRALYHFARGQWVLNLDGDDHFIDCSFITTAISAIRENPQAVIVSGRIRIESPTGYVEPQTLGSLVMDGRDVVINYHDSRYHFPHASTLYLRSRALECDFYRMNVISADWESLLRLALLGKVIYLDTVAACWRLHGGNASLQCDWREKVSNLKIWESIYEAARKAGIPFGELTRARRKNLARVACRDLSAIFIQTNFGAVLKYAWFGAPILGGAVLLQALLNPTLLRKGCRRAMHNVAVALRLVNK